MSVTGDDTSSRDHDEPRWGSLVAASDIMILQHSGERASGVSRIIDIKADSGKAEVPPPGFAQEYPIKPSAGSRSGAKYKAASGNASPN